MSLDEEQKAEEEGTTYELELEIEEEEKKDEPPQSAKSE